MMLHRFTVILTLWLFSLASFAEEGESVPQTKYIDMKPAFVANFGGPAKRMKYVKADVALRVSAAGAEPAIQQHMPYLRNEIVLLLSAQDEATISSPEGQEKLRTDALAKVNAVLKEEAGAEYVEDLLFTSFVLQR